MNRVLNYILFILFLYNTVNLNCNSQTPKNQKEKNKLILNSKIDLPNVKGRIDHIAYDSVNQLVFIAALGNNTVEVVNINTKRVEHTITGLQEPQGVIYIPSLKKLVVANGGNGDCIFFDAITFKQSGLFHLKNDADNLRFDSTSNLLYVGYGNGAIAVVNVISMKQVGDILLDGHPESFQVSKKQNRLYINVPDQNEIEVAELTTNKIIARWKNAKVSSNFPMALDEDNDHLFIGYRNPARLRMINIETGEEVATATCSGDADDVFYKDSLVFVSAGKGFIDVFRVKEKTMVKINEIKTRSGARTSLLLGTEKKLLLAVPAHVGNSAALWIYNLVNS